MKYLSIYLLLFLVGGLTAQTSTIKVQATGCPGLQLYAFNGSGFDAAGKFTKDQTTLGESWTLELPGGKEHAFRYVGTSASNALPVIVGEKNLLIVARDCKRLRGAKVMQSPINDRYLAVKQTFQRHNKDFTTTMRAYNQAQAKGDSVAMKQEAAALATLDDEKRQFITSLAEESPLLERVARLNTYLSFVNENKGRFPNELDYFVNTYFQFVDFQDPAYNDLPWTYEGNRNFANTLASAVPGKRLADILTAVYDRWPAGSKAQLFAMTGGFASLAQKKHAASLPLAETIIERFGDKYPDGVQSIRAQAKSLATFAVGATAPDFTGESPKGESISLSSLRGKIVLIDFWASWCGPCRKENPNVVRLYDKYKDAGFEILGVSLDKAKDRWVKAIADDKLDWLHISDLKGWQSQYARQYGVSSIPQTVLLDKDGNILARNLRGEALQQKLAEIFSTK